VSQLLGTKAISQLFTSFYQTQIDIFSNKNLLHKGQLVTLKSMMWRTEV